MADSILQIVINAVDNATGSIKKVSDRIKDMEQQFDQVGKAVTVFGGGITAALGFAMKAAADSDEAWAKVSQQIKLSGLDFEKTKKTIQEFSTQTQRLTGISDEYSAKIAGLLLPTVRDAEKATKLAALALDIEASGKMSAESATRALALAHLGEIDALKRLVPDLKLVSDETLNSLSVSERSKMALEALAGQYGGLAQAIGQTPTGQIKILTETIGDLAEKVGNILNPYLTKLVNNHLLPLLDKIDQWTSKNPELTEQIIKIVAVIGALAVVFGPILVMLPGLIAGFTLLFSPIGLITVAVLALIAAGVALYMNWDYITQKGVEVWNKFKAFLYQTFDGVRIIFIEKWTAIKEFLYNTWEGIKDIFQNAINWIMEKLQPLLGAIDKVKSMGGSIGSSISGAFNGLKNTLGVNDAIISPDGKIITTHPDDYLIATKTPGSLGGGVVVNVTGNYINSELDLDRIGDAIMNRLRLNGRLNV